MCTFIRRFNDNSFPERVFGKAGKSEIIIDPNNCDIHTKGKNAIPVDYISSPVLYGGLLTANITNEKIPNECVVIVPLQIFANSTGTKINKNAKSCIISLSKGETISCKGIGKNYIFNGNQLAKC